MAKQLISPPRGGGGGGAGRRTAPSTVIAQAAADLPTKRGGGGGGGGGAERRTAPSTVIGQPANLPTKRGGCGGGGGAGGPVPHTGTPQPKGAKSSARIGISTLGTSQERPIHATSAIIELEIHGYHLVVLESNSTGVKRTDKALRSAITTKGNEWFGETFFTLLPGKKADTSQGNHHLYYTASEDEILTGAPCSDLDIYHNASGYPVEVQYYRDTKIILTVLAEIKPRMGLIS